MNLPPPTLPELPEPDEQTAPNYGICNDTYSFDLVEDIQRQAYDAALASARATLDAQLSPLRAALSRWDGLHPDARAQAVVADPVIDALRTFLDGSR